MARARRPEGGFVTIGAIDIGTNTALLLVARVDEGGVITPLASEHRIPRLGVGVDGRRRLLPEAMERAVAVVTEYQSIVTPFSPAVIVVVGTSAVRDAENRDEFASLLKKKTGYALEVIGGDDEALWSFRGTLSGFPPETRATVLDIGGGSTELTIGTEHGIDGALSADVGAVRLTERFFHHDPPTPQELDLARESIEEAFGAAAQFQFRGSRLIGIAGTVTSLAHLAQGKSAFDPSALIQARLTSETVERLYATLRTLNSSGILSLSTVMEGRADVITAGTLILRELMVRFGFPDLAVSERGLRYGLVLREWLKLRG